MKKYSSKLYTVAFLIIHTARTTNRELNIAWTHWSRPKHVFLAGPVFRPGRAGFKATGPGRAGFKA